MKRRVLAYLPLVALAAVLALGALTTLVALGRGSVPTASAAHVVFVTPFTVTASPNTAGELWPSTSSPRQ